MFPEPDSTELGNLLKRLTTRSGTLMSSHKNLIELLEHIWSWLFWFILINTPTGFWEQSHRLQSKACWETPVEESPFSVKSQVRRTNMGFRKRKPEASAGLLPGLREGTSPSLHPYIRKNWNYRNGGNNWGPWRAWGYFIYSWLHPKSCPLPQTRLPYEWWVKANPLMSVFD